MLVVYKKSALQIFSDSSRVEFHKKTNPDMYRNLEHAHEVHLRSVSLMNDILLEMGIRPQLRDRDDLTPGEITKEPVISLGGDGTFLNVSHFLKETPLIGVNSAPEHSVGHYCNYDILNKPAIFRKDLSAILEGKKKPGKTERLTVYLNGNEQEIPLLNDVLITEENPAAMSRYEIRAGKRHEMQKSSGIWVSTAMGATAGYGSAGGKKFRERNTEGLRQFGFVVRELYQKNEKSLHAGILTETETFEVISAMIHGKAYLDGSHQPRDFGLGDHIRIEFCRYPLFFY